MFKSIIHHYREIRRHQLETYGFDTFYKSGRTEASGGGAAYGFHAIAAFNMAKSRVHFMDRMKKDIKEHKKRSEAAKRGWKKRRLLA